MAMLVHHQGEILNNIELNVNDSKNYLDKSLMKLDSAKKDHIAARKVLNKATSLNYINVFTANRKCA